MNPNFLRRKSLWLCLALAVLPLEAAGRSTQAADQPDSLNWPKEVDSGGSKILVYQPQLESLSGNEWKARAAVSVQKAGEAAPAFGGVWLSARLLTDRDTRTATPVDVQVTQSRFPNSTPEEAAELGRLVASEIPKWRLSVALDQLQADLKVVDEQKSAAQGLQNAPPRILYRSHAAMILSYEGEPSWREVPGTAFRRVMNTAFFVVQDPGTGTCYLRVAPFWWQAAAPMGPWEAIEAAPAPAQALWDQEPKGDLPPPDAGQPVVPERPEVIASAEPAELIWTHGPPQYDPLDETDLLHVTNTESDIFLDSRARVYYVLLSGRWYSKPQGTGAWTYVAQERLPADFGRIPVSAEMKHVLACVAGTPQAKDAVLDAEIPQTVAVTPGPAPDLAVNYDGAPDFRDVPECPVQYAVNTPYSVFLVQGRYYCCQDGIWYDAGAAVGPWSVCTLVPPDIYLIPPSCPLYYCTYCHVFGATPGAVYCGYYPGYRGCYVLGRTVVYGTGWHYRCWSGSAWYPRPVTWGCGVRYSLSTGNWKFRLGLGGPCAWMGLAYHPEWRGHAVSVGVGGWWTGVGGRRGDVDVHRNFHFVDHNDRGAVHNIYARSPERLAPIHAHLPPEVRAPGPERRVPNNVYTDPHGQVYRKPAAGTWERHTPEGWKPDVAVPERREPVRNAPAPVHQPPAPHPAPREVAPIPAHHVDLERQQQARNLGNQRTQEYHQNPPPRPAPHPAPAPRQRR